MLFLLHNIFHLKRTYGETSFFPSRWAEAVLEASKVSGLKRKKDSDAEPVNLAGDSWIFVSWYTPRKLRWLAGKITCLKMGSYIFKTGVFPACQSLVFGLCFLRSVWKTLVQKTHSTTNVAKWYVCSIHRFLMIGQWTSMNFAVKLESKWAWLCLIFSQDGRTKHPTLTPPKPTLRPPKFLPSPRRLHQWVGHSNLVSHHLTTCGLAVSQVFHVRWRVVDGGAYQLLFSTSKKRCHQVLGIIHSKSFKAPSNLSKGWCHQGWFLTCINQNHPLLNRRKSQSLGAPRHPVWWWPKIRQRRSRTSLQCSKTRLHGCMAVGGRN